MFSHNHYLSGGVVMCSSVLFYLLPVVRFVANSFSAPEQTVTGIRIARFESLKKLSIVLGLFMVCLASAFSVDSVTVDSVWNSDSSWNGGANQRQSRDCWVSFKLVGNGMVQCSLSLSVDGGATWSFSPESLMVLGSSIKQPIACGTKGRVKVRVLGGDRPNVVMRINSHQTAVMVSVPEGSFNNGISVVTLGAFKMSTTEITQVLYSSIMGVNPSHFNSDEARPVETVNWYDAALFCNAFSKLMSKETVYVYTGTMGSSVVIDYSKNGYRLPTEAEWEYSCRAGTTSAYYWGSVTDGAYCWYSSNSASQTHPVGTKKPNSLGLYDMSGNVFEWCNDWYSSYPTGPQTNPTGPKTVGSYRVLRGGSWIVNGLASGDRDGSNPGLRDYDYGFRLVSCP